jgi:hypothetical protein
MGLVTNKISVLLKRETWLALKDLSLPKELAFAPHSYQTNLLNLKALFHQEKEIYHQTYPLIQGLKYFND